MKLELFNVMKNIIGDAECSFIGEIGTHKGSTAKQFIQLLAPRVKHLTYYGYDVFDGDNPNREMHKLERNAKAPQTIKTTTANLNKIKKTHQNFDFVLHKGFTTETLSQPIEFDFVYIDGGHSYDTVKHDYNMVKNSKLIVFDDYKIPGVNQNIAEIKEEGINVELVRTPSKHTWAVIRN